jgi:hypothetical protein
MACRVRKDPPATGIDMQQPATQTENLRLGAIEIGNLDIQVKLLRVRGVWPPWRAMIQSRHEEWKGAADRPAWIRLVDHTSEKLPIEPRELERIGTVKDHALKPAEHRPSLHATDHRHGAP